MLTINTIDIDGMMFTAIRLELPKANVLIITNEVGFVIGDWINNSLMNQSLTTDQVVAGCVNGAETIDDLLYAPLQIITDAAKVYGWHVGMMCKEALLKIA